MPRVLGGGGGGGCRGTAAVHGTQESIDGGRAETVTVVEGAEQQ